MPARVKLAVRVEVEGFADATAITDPLPVPVVVLSVKKDGTREAFHAQDWALAATPKVISDTVPGRLTDVGATAKEQMVEEPASISGTCCPAIVMIAERDDVPGFAVAVTKTAPVPVPLELLRVAHDWLEVAVQVQLGSLGVTSRVTVPPVKGKEPEGVTAYVQEIAPASVTETDWPAMVTKPFSV
jgi:hypothetical protein